MDAIPSYICEHPCRLWEALLCQRFCEFRAHLWEVLLSQKFLCVPCVLWELLHRLFGWCSGDSCTPWAGSVGMAGMPYPPTSVRIRVICGRLFSARGSVYSVHSVGASSPLVRLVQQRQLHPLGRQRGYGRDAIPSYICEHPCHLWESFLCQRFCVFGAFRGSLFTACSVGAAETAAPPGGIHGSSAHISPPHHLTTTTPFHLEPSLLHVLPVLWV